MISVTPSTYNVPASPKAAYIQASQGVLVKVGLRASTSNWVNLSPPIRPNGSTRPASKTARLSRTMTPLSTRSMRACHGTFLSEGSQRSQRLTSTTFGEARFPDQPNLASVGDRRSPGGLGRRSVDVPLQAAREARRSPRPHSAPPRRPARAQPRWSAPQIARRIFLSRYSRMNCESYSGSSSSGSWTPRLGSPPRSARCLTLGYSFIALSGPLTASLLHRHGAHRGLLPR